MCQIHLIHFLPQTHNQLLLSGKGLTPFNWVNYIKDNNIGIGTDIISLQKVVSPASLQKLHFKLHHPR